MPIPGLSSARSPAIRRQYAPLRSPRRGARGWARCNRSSDPVPESPDCRTTRCPTEYSGTTPCNGVVLPGSSGNWVLRYNHSMLRDRCCQGCCMYRWCIPRLGTPPCSLRSHSNSLRSWWDRAACSLGFRTIPTDNFRCRSGRRTLRILDWRWGCRDLVHHSHSTRPSHIRYCRFG